MTKIKLKYLTTLILLASTLFAQTEADLSCVDILNDLNSTTTTFLMENEPQTEQIAKVIKRFEKYTNLTALTVETFQFEILQKKTQETAGYMVELSKKLSGAESIDSHYLELYKSLFQAIVSVQKSMQHTFDTFTIDDRLQNMLPFIQSRIALNHAKISLLTMAANVKPDAENEKAYRKTITYMLNHFDQKVIEKDADVNKDHSIVILRKLVSTLAQIDSTVSRRQDVEADILFAKVKKKYDTYNRRLAIAEQKQKTLLKGSITDAAKINSGFGLTFEDLYATHSAYEFFDLGVTEPDYNEKINYFSQAIEQKPDFIAAIINRGVCYDALKKYNEAVSDYSRVLQLEPLNRNVLSFRALAFINLKNYEKALADFRQLINLDAQDENSWLYAGVCYEKLGDAKQAQKHYDSALMLAPYNITALKKRALFFQAQNETKKAVADYTTITELAPNDASAWYNLGVVYYNLRLWKKAIQAWKKCLEIEPDHEPAKKYLPIAEREMRK